VGVPEGRLRRRRSCNDIAVSEDQITICLGRHNPTTNRRGRRRLLAGSVGREAIT
jgi:hypothetical protein